MTIDRDLQSPVLNVRHPIHFVRLKKPRRQCGRSEPRIAGRNAEEKHFLPARKDSRAQNFREQLSEPRATREDEMIRQYSLARPRCDRLKAPGTSRRCALNLPVFNTQTHRILNHRHNRAPRHQYTALRFEKPCTDALEANLWVVLFECRAIHPFERNSTALECRRGLPQPRILFPCEPQNTGLVKERLLHCGKKFLPLHQRALRPSRIKLIRSVAHSNDARLPARTRARVGRPVRIHEQNSPAPPRHMPRRPRAKHSSANHRYVVPLLCAHRASILPQAMPTPITLPAHATS